MPTRTRTTRPSGRVASRSTGFARRVMAGGCQRSRDPQGGCDGGGSPDRIVHFRPRTIFSILGILLGVGLVLYVLWVARHVLSWLLIALFLALALNPAVEWLQRHGVKRRGAAAGATFLVAIAVVVGFGFLFVPTLVDQVNAFANSVPDYVAISRRGAADSASSKRSTTSSSASRMPCRTGACRSSPSARARRSASRRVS